MFDIHVVDQTSRSIEHALTLSLAATETWILRTETYSSIFIFLFITYMFMLQTLAISLTIARYESILSAQRASLSAHANGYN